MSGIARLTSDLEDGVLSDLMTVIRSLKSDLDPVTVGAFVGAIIASYLVGDTVNEPKFSEVTESSVETAARNVLNTWFRDVFAERAIPLMSSNIMSLVRSLHSFRINKTLNPDD